MRLFVRKLVRRAAARGRRLFHGTDVPGLKTLQPRDPFLTSRAGRLKRQFSPLQPKVFATGSTEFALASAAKRRAMGQGRFRNGRVFVVPAHMRADLAKPGFIYQVARPGFRRQGNEFTNTNPVPVQRAIRVSSLSGAMTKRGWKIVYKEPRAKRRLMTRLWRRMQATAIRKRRAR